LTGCEDYKIRTFTRDFGRRDEGSSYKDYENECKAASIGQSSDVDISKLPSVEQIRTLKGKKDGEIRVFKNGTMGEAYCWKEENGKWEKIGDVINPSGGGGVVGEGGKVYEGDRLFEAGEYDHIFDIDLGDGLMRKLPYDNGGNAQEAADKFIVRESLHKGYVEQISTFVRNNSIPYKTSDLAAIRKGGASAVGAAAFGGQ
jgi:phospholipase A-2-activating protein